MYQNLAYPCTFSRHGKQGIILGRKGLTTLKKVCKKVKNSETYKGIAFIESSYRVTEFKKRKKKVTH